MKRTNARILVVDHDRSTRERLSGLLRDLGFPTVDEAADAPQAIELFRQRPYNLVIIEAKLPHCSGLELLRAIRITTGCGEVAVLVLGSALPPREVVEILYAGANGFMAKPIVDHALCAKVLRVVAKLPPTEERTMPSRSELWA